MNKTENSLLLKCNIVLLICVIGASVLFYLNASIKFNDHLSWDELNYETLARKGIAYNALEENSLNFVAFLKIGMARANKDTLLNEQLVKEYNYPDENENPFYLRHYHPPLANYFWSFFINDADIVKNDKNLRFSNIILALIAMLSLVGAVFFAKKLNRTTLFVALSLLTLLVLSTIFNYSFEKLNFHTFQFICSLTYVGFLMRWLAEPSKKNSILLGISVALMFVALETALFIVAGSVVALLLTRNLKIFFKNLLSIVTAFFVAMIVFWPGVVKTLAPIKTWIMHFARIFLKGNDEYAGISMSDAWKNLFLDNMFLFTILLICIISLLMISRKQIITKTHLIPYIVALFYLMSITPFILNKTYVFPVIGLFLFAIIYNIGCLPIKLDDKGKMSGIIKYKYAILTLAVFSYTVINVVNFSYKAERSENIKNRAEFNDEVNKLKVMLAEKNNVIAFNGQLLRYYVGDESIRDMRKNQMANPGYFVREKGLYVNVLDDLKAHKIEAVVFPKDNIVYYPEERTKILEEHNFKKIDLNHFRIFLSQKNKGY